jgi:hypothetical protein
LLERHRGLRNRFCCRSDRERQLRRSHRPCPQEGTARMTLHVSKRSSFLSCQPIVNPSHLGSKQSR